MKTIKITTPENIEVEYRLAGLGSRAAAAIIDLLIQGLIIFVLGLASFLFMYGSIKNGIDYNSKSFGWFFAICILLLAAINYGYYIVLELTMNGRTIGKKIFKLRTIRNNGQPITGIHSAIRNLIKVFIDLYGIGVITMFFSKEQKRLGDYAASTIVIVEETRNIPFSLDTILNRKEEYRYALTNEEYSLLKDYFERKNKLEDKGEKLGAELREYFTKKYEAEGMLSDMEELLKEI